MLCLRFRTWPVHKERALRRRGVVLLTPASQHWSHGRGWAYLNLEHMSIIAMCQGWLACSPGTASGGAQVHSPRLADSESRKPATECLALLCCDFRIRCQQNCMVSPFKVRNEKTRSQRLFDRSF